MLCRISSNPVGPDYQALSASGNTATSYLLLICLEILHIFLSILKEKVEITQKVQERYYQCPKTFVLATFRTLAAFVNKVSALPIHMLPRQQDPSHCQHTKLPERREELKWDGGGVDVHASLKIGLSTRKVSFLLRGKCSIMDFSKVENVKIA